MEKEAKRDIWGEEAKGMGRWEDRRAKEDEGKEGEDVEEKWARKWVWKEAPGIGLRGGEPGDSVE